MLGIEFAYKWWLWIAGPMAVIIPLLAYYFKMREAMPTLTLNVGQELKRSGKSIKHFLQPLLLILRILTLLALVFAIGRPQSSNKWQKSHTDGIDIVLSLDVSGSMLAQDFSPNRLEASKTISAEFVSNRPDDRIGLVIFSGEALTKCPVTSDHSVVVNLLNGIEQGVLEDGTAIGLGLANAVARLKESKAKSKVIILLTDGVNNLGEVAPLTAAEIALTYGIRVYTIGVGKNGFAPFPVQTPFGMQLQNMEVKIDEDVLTQIADKTGGKYFRATDNKKLSSIYKEIDKLEKNKAEVQNFSSRSEEFFWFIVFAGIFFLLEYVFRFFIIKSFP